MSESLTLYEMSSLIFVDTLSLLFVDRLKDPGKGIISFHCGLAVPESLGVLEVLIDLHPALP